VPGPEGLRRLGERLGNDRVALAEAARDVAARRRRQTLDVWESPDDEGRCPRCGEPVDEETDACEDCLDQVVRELDHREADAADEATERRDEASYVRLLSDFLAERHDPDRLYCPVCLIRGRQDDERCLRCGGDMLHLDEAMDVVRLARLDIVETWWTPLVATDDTAWFDAVLPVVAAACEDYRTSADFVDNLAYFSPILADMQKVRKTVWVRLADFPAVAEAVEGAELAAVFPERTKTLLARIATTLDAVDWQSTAGHTETERTETERTETERTETEEGERQCTG